MSRNPLLLLQSFGQSIWLDFIRRGMIQSGELGKRIEQDGLRGVTSNPAIFEKAIAGSDEYDQSIRSLAAKGRDVEDIYRELVVDDIQRTADLFRPLYEQTRGGDGFVSLEVSPHLAHDARATVEEGRALWAAVSRPNLLVKVPGTREGLQALRTLLGEGINVNVTLLFGLPRYREVAEAYLAGLEDRSGRVASLERVASVASFFLSRIDVLIDPRLEEIEHQGGPRGGRAAALRGKAAIASAKIAYQIYREIYAGERFRKLAAQGARPQRLLWASTSTKNPQYSDVMYVDALIGPETVNTVPLETLDAYRNHGRPAPRLEQGLDEAHHTHRELAELGIDLDAVTRQLEDEGVTKFVEPFDLLTHRLEAARSDVLAEGADRRKPEAATTLSRPFTR